MAVTQNVLILDSLFDDLTVEEATAHELGWTTTLWDGAVAALATAQVVVHVRTKVDGTFMDRAPGLQVVGRFGTGLDSVDLAAAAARGVAVVGIRDYCTPELVAHTLGLAFLLERRLDTARAMRLDASSTWTSVARALGVVGRTRAVVIGFGAVGSAVTRSLLATGWSVRVVTEHGAKQARAIGAEPASLDDALADAEVVFLHPALTERTRGMIDDAVLARMPPGALLIDTARIGLIDERAVAVALASGHLAGVGIDARLEPASPLAVLGDHPGLVVTPHVGWYSERSARILRQRTISDTIRAFTVQEEGTA